MVPSRKQREKSRSTFKSLRKLSTRKMFLENLEPRQLLAVGPQLIGIQPNTGELLKDGDVRSVAPTDLTFRFDQNQRFNDTQLQQTGIQITRANQDGTFQQASLATDLNTNGATQVTFTATRYGQQGNDIQIIVNKSNQGAPGLPTISVTGSVITANLNTYPGYESTAQDLVNAVNNNLDARALVLASVPTNQAAVKVGDRTINYSPLRLGLATASSSFNSGGAVNVKFSAVPVGATGNGTTLVFNNLPLGVSAAPQFAISGKTVTVTLNSTAGSETTAKDLVDAINASTTVNKFLTASLTGTGTTKVATAANAGLTLVLSGAANDIVVTPGYIGTGDAPNQNEIVVRFADPLPDDVYRIDIFGAVSRLALRNLPDNNSPTGTPFLDLIDDGIDKGSDFSLKFQLNLGPQVVSVVPQPVGRDGTGALTQARNQILVYFNADPLASGPVTTDPNPANWASQPSVVNPTFYQLLSTSNIDPLTGKRLQDTARNTDDVVFNPTKIEYDPLTETARLTFAQNLDQLLIPTGVGYANEGRSIGPGSFRLRVGTNEAQPAVPVAVTATSDAGDSYNTSTDLNTAFGFELGLNPTGQSKSIVISSAIEPQAFPLQYPGDVPEVGSRDIVAEQHLPGGSGDATNGITTYYYNFRDDYGRDPSNNPLHNAITAAEKQRTREIFALYSSYLGVNFVEDVGPNYRPDAFVIATGDMRAVSPLIYSQPKLNLDGEIILDTLGVAGADTVFGRPTAIIDSGQTWDDEYGRPNAALPNTQQAVSWFEEAMHEIGHLLGLGHSTELPPLTIMSATATPGLNPTVVSGPGEATLNSVNNVTNTVEPVYPGDNDIVHGQNLYRPDSTDIDLYKFAIPAGPNGQGGTFTAEVLAQRLANASQLDSVVHLYQEVQDASGQPVLDPATGLPERTLVAQNDDYFGKDSYLDLALAPGTYYLGVSAHGNETYDPTVSGTGIGATTQGAYDLRLNFRPQVSGADTIQDATGTQLDGNLDGVPGGVYDFWFRADAPTVANAARVAGVPQTIFVDKSFVDTAGTSGLFQGSLSRPYNTISTALAAAQPGDIVRIVGNGGLDKDLSSLADNKAYQIGFDSLVGSPLADGYTLDVPKGVTVMIDAGAEFKLRRARIDTGSSSASPLNDRSAGALQVLGTPYLTTNDVSGVKFALDALGNPAPGSVYFTSLSDTTIGTPSDPLVPKPLAGDWGGLDFRSDLDHAAGRFDYEQQGVFLNYVNHADIRYGGGDVVVEGSPQIITPVQMLETRPTVSFNSISHSKDAAISGDPDSFAETTFTSASAQLSGPFTADYKRVGPDVHRNTLSGNAINGLLVRIATPAGNQLKPMTVSGRFDDTDITYVITETLQVQGTPGGPLQESAAPAVNLVTVRRATATDGTLPPNPVNTTTGKVGSYNYRIVFLDKSGNPGVVSAATAGVTITTLGQKIQLTALPITSGDFVSRLLYRSDATGDSQLPYTLVARLNGSDATYLDTGLTLGGSLQPGDFLPAVDLVTLNPVQGGTLAAGTYNYRVVFVDSFGGPGLPSLPTVDANIAAATTLNPVVAGAIELTGLPTSTSPTVSRLIYRSDATGNVLNAYTLVGRINGTDATFTDTGVTLGDTLIRSQLSQAATATAPAYTPTLSRARGRADASLTIDPGVVVKSNAGHIETTVGGQVTAEGVAGRNVIFTSLNDDRYGASGTFDTNNDFNSTTGTSTAAATPGDWGGIFIGPTGSLSLDHAVIAYAGGVNRVQGNFIGFNAIDLEQATARITNSVFEHNANGLATAGSNSPTTRYGRGFNGDAVIFIRGSQPVVVANTFRNNTAAALNINVNALNATLVDDLGRDTGPIDKFDAFGNQGPLIRKNLIGNNALNGMIVRGGTLTTEGVWDDTDIVHILRSTSTDPSVIVVPDFHTYGGLRLQSSATSSLVVKLLGATAGFTANGRPLDITDRIGGMLQIIGQPGYPVVLTSLNDDTVGAGSQPDGAPQTDTNGNGSTTLPRAGDWRSILIDEYANDRNVDTITEQEASDANPPGPNATANTAQYLGNLAPNENAGDDIRRLGFTVHGFLNAPSDRDVYSFDADVGTEVWINVDRTTASLDSVVELLDSSGNVIARSDNRLAEESLQVTVQQLTFGGVPVGTFTLSYGTLTTGLITYSDTPAILIANIQAALDGILGTGNTVVSESSNGSYSVVFTGDLASATVAALTATNPSLSGTLTVRSDGPEYVNQRAPENRTATPENPDLVPLTAEQLADPALLYGQARLIEKTPAFSVRDHWTLNPKDPAMRVVLPGPAGQTVKYFVRVRSSSADLSKLDAGLTEGAYQLQVRLQEQVEFGGSTVRLAKISYASIGIELRGQPAHSPLIGEAVEIASASTAHGTPGSAEALGNLLNSDRATLSVAGQITNSGFLAGAPQDVDMYRFEINYDSIEQVPGAWLSTTFDVDYADGLARPQTHLWVFDSAGHMVLSTLGGSNVADDQPAPLGGANTTNLSGGSVGALDPYIGTARLPTGTYYVAVTGNARIPNQLLNTPLYRLEPVDSVGRIVEDHLELTPARYQATAAPAQVTSLVDSTSMVPFTLGDVSLYVAQDFGYNTLGSNGIQDTRILTADPFTGAVETVVTNSRAESVNPVQGSSLASFESEVGDIALKNDGNLYGYTVDTSRISIDAPNDAMSGNYLRISPADGTATNVGDDGITTYERDPASPAPGTPVVAHDVNGTQVGYGVQFEGVAYGVPSAAAGNNNVYRGLAVGNRGDSGIPNVNPEVATKTNILYQFDTNSGVVFPNTGGPTLYEGDRLPVHGDAATDATELGELLSAARITAPDATTAGPGTPASTVFNIADASSFTIANDQSTNTFEFDSGPEVRQAVNTFATGAINPANTIRDGNFFILDPDRTVTGDEVIYQLDTGPVIVVTGQPTDGQILTIQSLPDPKSTPPGKVTAINFEFDSNAKLTGANTVAIDIQGLGSQQAIATAISNAINGSGLAGAGVMAAVASNRISLVGDNGVFSVQGSTGISIESDTGQAPIIQGVDGSQLNDGDTFSLNTVSTGNRPTIFEFESGYVLQVPAAGGAAFRDGDNFTLTYTNPVTGFITTRRFEFNDLVNGPAGVNFGSTRIDFDPNLDTQDTMALAIATAIRTQSAALGGLNPQVLDNGHVQLGGTTANALPINNSPLTVTGQPGVAAGHIVVNFTAWANFTAANTITAIYNAITLAMQPASPPSLIAPPAAPGTDGFTYTVSDGTATIVLVFHDLRSINPTPAVPANGVLVTFDSGGPNNTPPATLPDPLALAMANAINSKAQYVRASAAGFGGLVVIQTTGLQVTSRQIVGDKLVVDGQGISFTRGTSAITQLTEPNGAAVYQLQVEETDNKRYSGHQGGDAGQCPRPMVLCPAVPWPGSTSRRCRAQPRWMSRTSRA